MTIKVLQVNKKAPPQLQLIGRSYQELKPNAQGNYNNIWQDWYQQHHFETLATKLGLTQTQPTGLTVLDDTDQSTYWLGFLMPIGHVVPLGYQTFILPKKELATAKISGQPTDPDFYGLTPVNESWKALVDAKLVDPDAWIELNISYEQRPDMTPPDLTTATNDTATSVYGFILP